MERLKTPYRNEGIHLYASDGGSGDLTPSKDVEYTILFPGGFLFVTHEGCALGLNPLARHEAVKAWADPKLDRLVSEFGRTSVAPPKDDVFTRVRDRSLEWHPKGSYVLSKADGGRLMLKLDPGSAPDSCAVLDCPEKAIGLHPDIPANTVSVNLCAQHRSEVQTVQA